MAFKVYICRVRDGENYLSDFVVIQQDCHSVDGSEIRRSPGEVGIFPIIYKVLAPSQVVSPISEPSTVGLVSTMPPFQPSNESLRFLPPKKVGPQF